MSWPEDEICDPRGRQYVVVARRMGISTLPALWTPVDLLWRGLTWALHATWHRRRWRVEVYRVVNAGRWRRPRVLVWRSPPLAGEDAAADVLDSVGRRIASGEWATDHASA